MVIIIIIINNNNNNIIIISSSVSNSTSSSSSSRSSGGGGSSSGGPSLQDTLGAMQAWPPAPPKKRTVKKLARLQHDIMTWHVNEQYKNQMNWMQSNLRQPTRVSTRVDLPRLTQRLLQSQLLWATVSSHFIFWFFCWSSCRPSTNAALGSCPYEELPLGSSSGSSGNGSGRSSK